MKKTNGFNSKNALINSYAIFPKNPIKNNAPYTINFFISKKYKSKNKIKNSKKNIIVIKIMLWCIYNILLLRIYFNFFTIYANYCF